MKGPPASGPFFVGSRSGDRVFKGPWIVNFGMDPSRSGNPLPSANAMNIVMATTSWGYTSLTQKVQGASRFGNNSRFTSRTNIGALVADVCAATPAAC